MRTTIKLSDEAHGMALSYARDQSITLSEAVNRLLLRRSGELPAPSKKGKSEFPVFKCVRRVSSDDVRRLEDDQ